MKIAYIIPTRNRPDVLRKTLTQLGSLAHHDAQVIVVDNDSSMVPNVPGALANGIDVQLLRRASNEGAAARNVGVRAADRACEWVIMLDDDSVPLSLGHLDALRAASHDTSAVAAEIVLPCGARESGGLPEVFIGCGVALRREAFEMCDGYDASFGYYAEEYDLAAKMMLAGWRIGLDRRFVVEHRKVTAGRDMNLIMHRLLRNNGWIMQRYAPARRRVTELRHVVDRYGIIARKEKAERGYAHGLDELFHTLRDQPRRPMGAARWDRFTGKAAAVRSLQNAYLEHRFVTAAIVEEGKNAVVVRSALRAMGVREVPLGDSPDIAVIGTLSPGPMLDAWARAAGGSTTRIVCPWDELINAERAARRAVLAAA